MVLRGCAGSVRVACFSIVRNECAVANQSQTTNGSMQCAPQCDDGWQICTNRQYFRRAEWLQANRLLIKAVPHQARGDRRWRVPARRTRRGVAGLRLAGGAAAAEPMGGGRIAVLRMTGRMACVPEPCPTGTNLGSTPSTTATARWCTSPVRSDEGRGCAAFV